MKRPIKLAKRVGDRVCRLRKARGMTQEQLADRCRHSRNTVSLVETAAVLPDLDTLEDICEALGISLAVFFRFRKR